MRLTAPLICLVTRGSDDATTTLARVRAAADAGVDLIQLREPQLAASALADLARSACNATRHTRARIVVNDRLDVAIAAGADGVHLRARSFDAARVLRVADAGFLIGRSVHSAEEAIEADRAGNCDYLVFGTVYPSASKPPAHPAAGLDALRGVCIRVQLPVIAIGGLTAGRAREVRAAGAAGIAAIGLFDDVRSIAGIVEQVRRAFDS